MMRSGAAVHVVMCRVTPEDRMPDGVDPFLGTAAQHRLGAKVDVKNDRMELWDANMVVDLEPVSKLTHHLMRCISLVSNPRIEYKSEFSNLV